jgi:hypothetical protein
VVRSGGGDQTLKDEAVVMLLKLTNEEEFIRREVAADTHPFDMARKLAHSQQKQQQQQQYAATEQRITLAGPGAAPVDASAVLRDCSQIL